MAVELVETSDGRTLEIQVTGKLTKEDYEHFVPRTEAMMEQATWIADRDLAVAGSLTVSSGPRVVMMADNSLPTLTRTSV